MAAADPPLLAIDEGLFVEHICSRLSNLERWALSLACRRLCRLVRRSIEVLDYEDDDCLRLAGWNAEALGGLDCCQGFMYRTPDAANELPGLSAMLAHAQQHWPSLRELSLEVLPTQGAPEGPASRPGNALVQQQLSALQLLRLQSLQLYATAPFSDSVVQQVARLKQLRFLLLADSSYVPGPAALVCVDLQPLTGLTALTGLAARGICPARLPPARLAGEPAGPGAAGAAAGGPAAAAGGGCLPASLLALTIKRLDSSALELWAQHLRSGCCTALEHLEVLHCLTPMPEVLEFPCALLRGLADSGALPQLMRAEFDTPPSTQYVEHSDVSLQSGALLVPLPGSVSRLRNLRELLLPSGQLCNVGIAAPGDWAAVAELSRLTRLDLGAVRAEPPADGGVLLPALEILAMRPLRTAAAWDFHVSFPQLTMLAGTFYSPDEFLPVARTLGVAGRISALALDLRYELDGESRSALEGLGPQLPALSLLELDTCGCTPGPDGWHRLPRLDGFAAATGLQFVGLGLQRPGLDGPAGFEPDSVGTTEVLAFLSPLRHVINLTLSRLHAHPGVVLGLAAFMTNLQSVSVIEPPDEPWFEDGPPAWDGSELRLVRAALPRPEISLRVYETADAFDADRPWAAIFAGAVITSQFMSF